MSCRANAWAHPELRRPTIILMRLVKKIPAQSRRSAKMEMVGQPRDRGTDYLFNFTA